MPVIQLRFRRVETPDFVPPQSPLAAELARLSLMTLAFGSSLLKDQVDISNIDTVAKLFQRAWFHGSFC